LVWLFGGNNRLSNDDPTVFKCMGGSRDQDQPRRAVTVLFKC
jgi:hypothetical protein